eukprot:10972772-Lingulodinium_polyedra.AAC.1
MERDFLVHARRSIGIRFDVFFVQTVIRQSDMKAVLSDRPVLLPTDVLSWLWTFQRARFHSIMGTAGLASYWAHVMRADPAWFREHPARERILRTGGVHDIPFGIFGDEAA